MLGRRHAAQAASVLVAVLLSTSAGSAGAKTSGIVLHRCGYTTAEYGKTAVYPWHISCASAKGVVLASFTAKDEVYDFSPGWDGGVVKDKGQRWVCTGQMGVYNCGYPYRPYVKDGSHGYRGPFTRDVAFQACALLDGDGCKPSTRFINPG